MTDDAKRQRRLAAAAAWRERNRERLRAYSKALYAKRREQRREYANAYYKAHPEIWKNYVENNRERVKKGKAANHIKNKEKNNADAREYGRDCRARNASIILNAKFQGCVDCGNTDPRVLDFDHVRGKKLGSIAYLAGQSGDPFNLLTEIHKCEVRCANCHRIKTWERRQKK